MFSFRLVLFSEFYKSAGFTKGQDTMLTIAKCNSLWRKLSHSPVDIPVITHSKASWGWLCHKPDHTGRKTKTKNTSSVFLFAFSLASTKYPLILFFYPSLFVGCFQHLLLVFSWFRFSPGSQPWCLGWGLFRHVRGSLKSGKKSACCLDLV